MFGSEKDSDEPVVDVKTLHAEIGELTLANDFLGRSARQVCCRAQRDDRPVAHLACEASGEGFWGSARGSVYYLHRLGSSEDLAIMQRMDALHLEFSVRGKPDNARFPAPEGYRDRLLSCREPDEEDGDRDRLSPPSTSKLAPGHKIYPCLLRKLSIVRSTRYGRQTSATFPWLRASSISSPSSTGRKVLSYRISITMEADFYVEALEEALARYGKPEVFNTDQGSQFTS